MDIGFVWDEIKYQAVVNKHNVQFYEVVAAFDDPDGYELSDPAEHEERWIRSRIYRFTELLLLLIQKGNGSMSTIKDDNFDYQTYMKKNSPDAKKINRGTKVRKQRFETAMKKFSVRIDDDIFEQFQKLVSSGHECEKLINKALREWLSAKGVKDLVRTELQQVVHEILYSYQDEMGAMKIADQKATYKK